MRLNKMPFLKLIEKLESFYSLDFIPVKYAALSAH